MKSNIRLSSLAITCFVASISQSVVQADEGFKCYGVSGPAENDCDPLDHNGHTCSAESERDHHAGDWKVAANEAECKQLGGLSEADARKKLGLPLPKSEVNEESELRPAKKARIDPS
jgi:uncharacterized membrane protein